MRKIGFLSLLLLTWAVPLPVTAFEIAPFQVRNQNPLVQIYGLPAATGTLPPAGSSEALLTADCASHFTESSAGGEEILLDGETYRFSLLLRHGIGENLAIGLELPYVLHSDGFLDSFIIDWHDTFDLPQGGRDEAPRKRLLFTYADEKGERLRLDEPADGLGDLRLNGGWRLLQREESALALHAALKLPTGDSDRLLGSGSTDLALWLAGDHATGKTFAVYAATGALFLTDGDILPDRQRNLVGFATLGGGWRPWSGIIFKLQLDGHTAFFNSDLPEMSESLLLTLGGTLDWGNTSLDIGVGEDLVVDSAPDVVFHLALRHRL